MFLDNIFQVTALTGRFVDKGKVMISFMIDWPMAGLAGLILVTRILAVTYGCCYLSFIKFVSVISVAL